MQQSPVGGRFKLTRRGQVAQRRVAGAFVPIDRREQQSGDEVAGIKRKALAEIHSRLAKPALPGAGNPAPRMGDVMEVRFGLDLEEIVEVADALILEPLEQRANPRSIVRQPMPTAQTDRLQSPRQAVRRTPEVCA